MPPRRQHADAATRHRATAGTVHPPREGAAPEPLAAAALLRLAGVPAALWASAGNPALFARADALADGRARHAARARALGVRLGEEVVPDTRLGTADRRAVLALRRRLHAGDVLFPVGDRGASGARPDPILGERLIAPWPALAGELRLLRQDAEALAADESAFVHEVAAERERTSTLLLHTALAEPALRGFLAGAAPRVVPDLERRAAAGEPWDGRRQRKGVGYLWRALSRTAAKTTPRDWAGQLAVLPSTGPGGTEGPALVLDPETGHAPVAGAPWGLELVAARRTENVHLLWSRLRDLDLTDAAPHLLLAPAPLHHATGEPGTGDRHFCVVDPDPGGGGRLRTLALRRTPALEAVMRLLAATPRTLGALEAALGPESSHPALRTFLAHLHTLGVLQVCVAPRAARLPWTARPPGLPVPLGGTPPGEDGSGDGDTKGDGGAQQGSFLDSYRAAARPADASADCRPRLARSAAQAVADGLGLARRVGELCEANRRHGERWQATPEAAALGAEPLSVARLVAAHADDPSRGPQPRAARTCWEPAHTPGSEYARLLAYLGARLEREQVDLDGPLLDALGAPPVPEVLEAWPVDCLVRPLAAGRSPRGRPGDGAGRTGPVAVLESASPAGVLDARFAEALGELYGADAAVGYPDTARYRDFLAAFERRTGLRFLEVLVPPLTEAAANAVRRPVATGWCTGDPDTPLYYGRCPEPGAERGPTALPPVRHLPLDRVTLRVLDGTLVAEADGVRVLPVHHATRTPAPPYDRLLPLLSGAGHPATRRMVRLDGLAGAFPEARRVPRLTVGGLLVVSPAQWRLPRTALWRTADSEPAKVTALAALRRSHGLPRFGYLRAHPAGKPLPVDLAALPVLQAVERLCQAEPGTDLVFEEALPAPDALPGPAGSPGRAAQVLLRLPRDRTAEQLAQRAHAAWRGAHSLPGTPPLSNGGGTPGRTPHPQ